MEPIKPASRIENVRYAIRNIVVQAKALEAQGKEILYCNVGDPMKFDFRPPAHMVDALVRAVREGDNGYAPSAGILPAREAVAREAARLGIGGVSAEDVVITTGASEAIELAMTALLEPGSEILLPAPGYPLYAAVAAKIGAATALYYVDEARGWSLDLEELESRVTPHTRAIVVNNPNNPTGAVYDRPTLLGLLEVARRRKLVVFADEIYDKLVFGTRPPPLASLADDVPVLTFNGLSKSYLACGWRVGWVIFSNRRLTSELRAAVLRLADARLCSPSPGQHAVAPALEGPQEHIAQTIEKLRPRRDLMVSRIREIPGLSVVEPQGAFYAMPRIEVPGFSSDEEFVLELLRKTGVLFVHGSGFGQRPGTQHFRLVLLPGLEVLQKAFDRLAEFVQKSALA